MREEEGAVRRNQRKRKRDMLVSIMLSRRMAGERERVREIGGRY